VFVTAGISGERCQTSRLTEKGLHILPFDTRSKVHAWMNFFAEIRYYYVKWKLIQAVLFTPGLSFKVKVFLKILIWWEENIKYLISAVFLICSNSYFE